MLRPSPPPALFLVSSREQAGRRLWIRPLAVLAGRKGSGGARNQVCAGCSRSLPTLPEPQQCDSTVGGSASLTLMSLSGSHLYHTDSSQIHGPGFSVPSGRDLGWLCGPTASVVVESHSPDPQNRAQPLRTKPGGWHCQVQSVEWWAFQWGWGGRKASV